jgi:uridine kinase
MKLLEGKKSFASKEEARAFVEIHESDFEKRLDEIAEKVCADRSIRLVALSGPSCSGKTTTANKLIRELKARGRKVHVVSIDDFFFDKERLAELAEENGDGKIDYDSIRTIDFDALVECVKEIFSDGKTLVPRFDFKEGRRIGYVEYDPDEDDLFIFEGIQAIYPEITAIFKQYPSVSVYICAESGVRIDDKIFEPNEIRLLRRLVRDYNFRASSPEFTMYLWDSVRSNEDANIFPHVDGCDMKIDSTLAFDVNILRPYLEEILQKMPEDNEFIEGARRIIEKIKDIEPVSKEYLSEDSLYNEFI